MYYMELTTDELVHEDDAYEYAKDHLDSMDDRDKADFVEWFFSGNWLRKSDEEVENEQRYKFEEYYNPYRYIMSRFLGGM